MDMKRETFFNRIKAVKWHVKQQIYLGIVNYQYHMDEVFEDFGLVEVQYMITYMYICMIIHQGTLNLTCPLVE